MVQKPQCDIAVVIRNAPPSLNEMIEISGGMNNAVHLNRLTPNNVEHQI